MDAKQLQLQSQRRSLASICHWRSPTCRPSRTPRTRLVSRTSYYTAPWHVADVCATLSPDQCAASRVKKHQKSVQTDDKVLPGVKRLRSKEISLTQHINMHLHLPNLLIHLQIEKWTSCWDVRMNLITPSVAHPLFFYDCRSYLEPQISLNKQPGCWKGKLNLMLPWSGAGPKAQQQ